MNKGKIIRYVGIFFMILLCILIDTVKTWFNISAWFNTSAFEFLSSVVNKIFF